MFDERVVTVYQAYSPEIAGPAVAAGRFVAPFKRERMTWIKPSLLWMAYRSGWATKPGQERVLAIQMTREGFEWALGHSCLSRFEPEVHTSQDAWRKQLDTSPVRIQWDPERSPTLAPLPYRAIQIGLGGEAVDRYVDEWTTAITDITDRLPTLRSIPSLLPAEQPYPIPPMISARIGSSS